MGKKGGDEYDPRTVSEVRHSCENVRNLQSKSVT